MGVLPRVLLIGVVACSCRDKDALDPKLTPANRMATSMTAPPGDAPHAQTPIRFTPLAATKIHEVGAAEHVSDLALRLEVRTVPRAPGFEYNLYFDDRRKPGDREFDAGGIKVVLDPPSLAFLVGTEVDFIDGPKGAGFKFKNPNVPGGDGVPDGPPTYGALDR